MHQNHLEALLRHRLLCPIAGESGLVGMMGDLRTYISNKVLVGADTTGLGNDALRTTAHEEETRAA